MCFYVDGICLLLLSNVSTLPSANIMTFAWHFTAVINAHFNFIFLFIFNHICIWCFDNCLGVFRCHSLTQPNISWNRKKHYSDSMFFSLCKFKTKSVCDTKVLRKICMYQCINVHLMRLIITSNVNNKMTQKLKNPFDIRTGIWLSPQGERIISGILSCSKKLNLVSLIVFKENFYK